MKNTEMLREFASPSAQWRGKPFWSWNGELRPAELRRQVGIFRQMGLGGYFMHSRSGLITEYLGKDWFTCINETAEEGIRLGMENWLYDEDRWPSGSAGGMVTTDERYRAKSLRIYQMRPERYVRDDADIAVFYADLDGLTLYSYRPLCDSILLPAPVGTWFVLVFRICPDKPESVFNGTTYIDTMNAEAVARFIELTHDRYKEECTPEAWASMKGIFTDEPHRGHGMDNRREEDGIVTCDIAYTDDFFERFFEAYGYDAKAILPELFYQRNGEKVAPIKLHWFDLACNLFDIRFAKQIQDRCRELGIAFTGHVLHEDSLDCQTVSNGSLMRFYRYMDIPGVDILSEGAYNPKVCKQVSSVARQMGKKMILSELYGCTGWQTNLRSHKEIGDWQALLGVNLRCHHLSWYTMEGESKRDYPASISHQSAWYADYDAVESYFARFGMVMAQGEPVCDLLVLNPIESVWCQTYLGWAKWLFSTEPAVHELNRIYDMVSDTLLGAHIDHDYGEEQIMADMASIGRDAAGKAVLKIGEMAYHTVLLAGMLTIRPTTLALLQAFVKEGGKVIFAGDVPSYVDAIPSEKPASLASVCTHVPLERSAIVEALKKEKVLLATLQHVGGDDAEKVLLQMRRVGEDLFVGLVNADREGAAGELTLTVPVNAAYHLEHWRMEDGKILPMDGALYYSGGEARAKISLAASESMILRFSSTHSADLTIEPRTEPIGEKTIGGSFAYRLSEENVLVLDYARVRVDSGAWSEVDEILRQDGLVRDVFGVEHRHGEMIQPWHTKLYDNDVLGKVEVEYRFLIDVMPEEDVYLAAERPLENAYSINGTALVPMGIDDFWVDDAFKRMRVPHEALKMGENVVRMVCDFRKNTNLEACYLLGAFGVRAEKCICRVIALPKTLDIARSLIEQGLPFYGAQVTYLIPHGVISPLVEASACAKVVLSKNRLALIRIKCGESETKILWEPYEADITAGIEAGCDLEITAVHTRRNTFGPLHQLPSICGSYGPGNFHTRGKDWSDDYVFVDDTLPCLTIRSEKEI